MVALFGPAQPSQVKAAAESDANLDKARAKHHLVDSVAVLVVGLRLAHVVECVDLLDRDKSAVRLNAAHGVVLVAVIRHVIDEDTLHAGGNIEFHPHTDRVCEK